MKIFFMKKWTIILQMSAENSLYLDMIEGFNTIGNCEISKDIHFIILFDGIKNDLEPREEKQYPSVYEMKKGLKYSTAKPDKNFGKDFEDLTNKENLTEILKYIKTKFDAENYAYIYSGHGSAGEGDICNGQFHTAIDRILPGERDEHGDVKEKVLEKRLTIRGWNYDGYCELKENKDIILVIYSRDTKTLTYKGLNKILYNVFKNEEKLAFIFLDTCWGMMIENCYTFKDVTDFFVATADEMPSTGVGYDALLNLLNKRPEIKPGELSKLLVAVNYSSNYADYASGREDFNKMGISLTCTDTTELDNLILNYFDPFCEHLRVNMRKLYIIFKKAAEQCKDYTYEDYSKPDHEDYGVYNIDLIWFLENILHFNMPGGKVIDKDLQILTHKLIQQVSLYLFKGVMSNNYEEAVLGGDPVIGGKGIAITLPKNADQLDNSMYKPEEPGEIPKFVTATAWKKMLERYMAHIKDLKIRTETAGFITGDWESLKENKNFSTLFNFDKSAGAAEKLSQFQSFLSTADSFKLDQKWGQLKKPDND